MTLVHLFVSIDGNTKMEETLQFVIMVQSEEGRESLLTVLLSSFGEATRRKANSCDLRENWIEIWENDDADAVLANQPDTGYLHFRWRLESTPMKQEVTESAQIQLAKDIVSCLEAHGCRCVVCANFEDLL